MTAQTEEWFITLWRGLWATLDMMIYTLIRVVLQGIFDISNLTASHALVEGIYSRVYVLLGVFMLFKLSFSFFTYIVDPDSMTDKSKGVGKLITNTIVMLLMLVALPSILFGTYQVDKDGNEIPTGLLVRAQNALLPMLPRILLGIKDNTGASSGNAESIAIAANEMAIAALQPFFSPAANITEVCTGSDKPKPADMQQIRDLGELVQKVSKSCTNPNQNRGLLNLFAYKYYVYYYSPVISTAVGILILILLLGITLDVAKRVFKLIILQMIAPIPIMSYIDPKSAKDGPFAAWLKQLTSTFLEIFLKLGLIYVVLMFIQQIVTSGLWSNPPAGFKTNPFRYLYVQLFMIIGLILFAKDAPKFIKDSLGIKDNPNGGFMGGALGKTLRGAQGAAAGLVSGGLAGAATGAVAGATSDPKQSAWRAGGDRAKQVATGNDKAKSGVAASLSEKFAKAQGNRAVNRLGASKGVQDSAEKQSTEADMYAKTAEQMYHNAMSSGASQEVVDNYRKQYEDAATEAADKKKNYETIKQARDSRGLTPSARDQRNKVSGSTASVIGGQTPNRDYTMPTRPEAPQPPAPITIINSPQQDSPSMGGNSDSGRSAFYNDPRAEELDGRADTTLRDMERKDFERSYANHESGTKDQWEKKE